MPNKPLEKRKKIENLLCLCTEAERLRFKAMYPSGVQGIKRKDLGWAIKQCEQTILTR